MWDQRPVYLVHSHRKATAAQITKKVNSSNNRKAPNAPQPTMHVPDTIEYPQEALQSHNLRGQSRPGGTREIPKSRTRGKKVGENWHKGFHFQAWKKARSSKIIRSVHVLLWIR